GRLRLRPDAVRRQRRDLRGDALDPDDPEPGVPDPAVPDRPEPRLAGHGAGHRGADDLQRLRHVPDASVLREPARRARGGGAAGWRQPAADLLEGDAAAGPALA